MEKRQVIFIMTDPEHQWLWAGSNLDRDPDTLAQKQPEFFGAVAFVDSEIGRVLDEIQKVAPRIKHRELPAPSMLIKNPSSATRSAGTMRKNRRWGGASSIEYRFFEWPQDNLWNMRF